VPSNAMKLPTDRAGPPHEADLFINGRTDTAVPPAATPFVQPAPLPPPPPPPAPVTGAAMGSSAPAGTAQNQPIGFEKDYGHVL